jgi:hypothetical protein
MLRNNYFTIAILLFTSSMMLLGMLRKKDVELGGLDIPSGNRSKLPLIEVDSLFNSPYANGDTACFKLLNDSTIQIMCVCNCEEFKNK